MFGGAAPVCPPQPGPFQPRSSGPGSIPGSRVPARRRRSCRGTRFRPRTSANRPHSQPSTKIGTQRPYPSRRAGQSGGGGPRWPWSMWAPQGAYLGAYWEATTCPEGASGKSRRRNAGATGRYRCFAASPSKKTYYHDTLKWEVAVGHRGSWSMGAVGSAREPHNVDAIFDFVI